MTLDDEDVRPRFLVRDRDSKFTREFDEVFRSEGVRLIKAPVRAPKARSHAERWVGTVRRECLDRLLILGRRHLEHVLATYGCITTSTDRTAHSRSDRRSPRRCQSRNAALARSSCSTGFTAATRRVR
jgi:putative transposase